jgi:hypothetical protein
LKAARLRAVFLLRVFSGMAVSYRFNAARITMAFFLHSRRVVGAALRSPGRVCPAKKGVMKYLPPVESQSALTFLNDSLSLQSGVEAGHPAHAGHAEQPAADHRAHDTQRDIEEEPFPCFVDQLTADEPGNQAEHDPRDDRHWSSPLSVGTGEWPYSIT